MARFLIAAAHKSSGKTVISTGLAAALHAQGDVVQCFKKGPDYIDPMWLAAASERPCYNLDFNTMRPEEFTTLLCEKSSGTDITLIEANKGLYDGVAADGSDSNATLAKTTQTPVILVIDCKGMTRGIAPLLIGYQAFDPEINIAAVILNKVGGARHEQKLRTAVETYTDIAVIGAVPFNHALDLGERHLGLTTPSETQSFNTKIKGIGRIVGAFIDLERLRTIAQTAPRRAPTPRQRPTPVFSGLRIAVAQDKAFGFYYPDDLERFEELGATLVPFNTFKATKLPPVDAVFIGGGFPETQMQALSANQTLREDIAQKLKNGLPGYAECGGLMYLCRSMRWDGKSFDMCGVVAGDAVMNARPQGRGYVGFETTPDHPWGMKDTPIKAHEFHYARIDGLPEIARFGRKMTRGCGINNTHDGVVVNNLVAGFCHQRNTVENPWVARFLKFVQTIKAQS